MPAAIYCLSVAILASSEIQNGPGALATPEPPTREIRKNTAFRHQESIGVFS
jgi:hypothetical protein